MGALNSYGCSRRNGDACETRVATNDYLPRSLLASFNYEILESRLSRRSVSFVSRKGGNRIVVELVLVPGRDNKHGPRVACSHGDFRQQDGSVLWNVI